MAVSDPIGKTGLTESVERTDVPDRLRRVEEAGLGGMQKVGGGVIVL